MSTADARFDRVVGPAAAALLADADRRLGEDDDLRAARYRGDRGVRQPVHTVYIPAHRYQAGVHTEWAGQALDLVDRHLSALASWTHDFGVPAGLAAEVRDKVRAKLEAEPIEDLRIDFEDGLGDRADETELAVAAARNLVSDLRAGQATPFYGVRFKSLEGPTRARGITTLVTFLAELAQAFPAAPAGLRLTLPKVTSVAQVEAMVSICADLEKGLGWSSDSLTFEIQIETPQAILAADGRALVAPMLHAAGNRCTALHYGTFDYSASLGIAAAYQSMEHPAADYAKQVMQVAAAGTGVFLSDGSTNVVPTGDAEQVRAAWQLHARLVRRSLERGYYQGWDMHPGHLPSRFAATYAFYLEGLPRALERLRDYVAQAGSTVMDEPATAIALAGFTLRAIDCGATDLDAVLTATGLDSATLHRLARRPVRS